MTFSPGSIVRITLHDFMTFKYMSVEFGPKLNVIVGSNGSGKSSLACAIVLGLAGRVKNLERAGSLGEFIRRGCNEAKIEIELFQPGGNIIVQRIIFKEKSTWILNGTSAALKLVEAKMKELSIQVDNLCQFLPQDKVHDFAKMSKQELLLNTQNSVGSALLAEMFQQLIAIKKNENTSEAEIKELENRLIALNEKHARLAKAWERVKDKQKMSDEINELKKKLAWVKYECKKNELAEEERQKKEKEKELQQIKLSVKPYLDEINELKNSLKNADDAVGRYKINENQSHGAFKNLLFSAKQWHSKIQVFKEEYEELIVEKSKKDEALRELENKIAEVEDLLNQEIEQELVYKTTEVTKEIEHVTIELNRLAENEYRCEQQVRADEVEVRQIERKVNEANNVLAQKLQLLKDTYPDVYRMREYVQKNENTFAGKVYGPIFLELIVENAVCAKYVEEVIPLRDMIAFVCEETEDVTRLATLSSSKGLRINVFEAPANDGPVKMVYKPKIQLNILKGFGFSYYIANVINGPEPVVRYLCDMYKLHEIPVGVSKVENCLNSIPKEIRRFFSDTQQFTVSFSRYSRERSTRCSHVRDRVRLLKYSAARPDEEFQRHLEQKSKALEISRQYYDISKNQRLDKDRKKNDLLEKKKTFLAKAQQLKFLKVRRENYKKEFLVLQSRDINLSLEEQKKNLKIKEALLNSSNEMNKSVAYLRKFQEAIERRSICSLNVNMINKKLAKKEGNFNDTKKQINVAEIALNVCQRACMQLKEDVRQLKISASKLTDNLSNTDPAFSKKFGKIFSKLPDDIEEIENRISEVKALADCLMGTDEHVEEEYKAVVKDLENLKEVISFKKSDRDKTSKKIKLLRDKWLPEINRLVERINKKFSLFFQQMNCVGEVSLSHGDENDFSTYGLSIRVKFRDSDSLQELDRYSQSGGERSVTIAVYMLSLQELTRVPFRCVDEINQGMDETNERRIYHLLMETIGDSNVSQYFLITPKLLKGIEFSEHVYVHTVLCGEQCTFNEQSVTIANFLKRLGNKNQSVSKRKRTIAYSDDSSDSE